MFKFVKNTKGFTLIEVIASIALFTVLTTGSLYIFQTAYFQTNQTQVKTSALNVARNTLMFMENQNFIETRKTFEELTDDEFLSIMLLKNKYTIFKTQSIINDSEDSEDSTTPEKISVDGVNFDVNIYADKTVESNSEFYSFYIPIKIVVSWELKGNHSVELKGDIKSEDLR